MLDSPKQPIDRNMAIEYDAQFGRTDNEYLFYSLLRLCKIEERATQILLAVIVANALLAVIAVGIIARG